jgi:hypothetical protein
MDEGTNTGSSINRREWLRRGVVVGGATMAWTLPVIRSLTPPASAQVISPLLGLGVSCCICHDCRPMPRPPKDPLPVGDTCRIDLVGEAGCASFCASRGCQYTWRSPEECPHGAWECSGARPGSCQCVTKP